MGKICRCCKPCKQTVASCVLVLGGTVLLIGSCESAATKNKYDCRDTASLLRNRWENASFLIVEVYRDGRGVHGVPLYPDIPPGQARPPANPRPIPAKVLYVSSRELIKNTASLISSSSSGERIVVSFAPTVIFRVSIGGPHTYPRFDNVVPVVDIDDLPSMVIVPFGKSFEDHCEFMLDSPALVQELSKWARVPQESIPGVQEIGVSQPGSDRNEEQAPSSIAK